MPPLQAIAYVEVESVRSCMNIYFHIPVQIASSNFKLKIIWNGYRTYACTHSYHKSLRTQRTAQLVVLVLVKVNPLLKVEYQALLLLL